MKIKILASGSKGNSSIIITDNLKILVDVGISKKKLSEKLANMSIDLQDIDAIFITHEHSDHIAGLYTIMKNYNIPIYLTKGTFEFVKNIMINKNIKYDNFIIISSGFEYILKDLKIVPFLVIHDAIEPVNYVFYYKDKKIAIVTDLGAFYNTKENNYKKWLLNLDFLALESNYDENVLLVSSYPFSLKKRIMSEKGHLSNEQAAKLLKSIINPKLKNVCLIHLSDENNNELLARETIRALLLDLNFNLYPILQGMESKLIEV